MQNKEEFSKNINIASMTCLIVLPVHVQYKTTKFTADDLKKNMNLRRPVWVFWCKNYNSKTLYYFTIHKLHQF